MSTSLANDHAKSARIKTGCQRAAIITFLAFAWLPNLPSQAQSAVAEAEQRPNVIVIFTDDLDFDEVPRSLYDLAKSPSHTGMKQQGFYDDDRPKYDTAQSDFFENPEMLMPNLEKLAAEGMVMDRFYITSPMCTPARFSLLTGRYASRSLGFQRKNPPGGPASIGWNTIMLHSEHNVPKTLQNNGYKTAMVGKWHMGHEGTGYNAALRNLSMDQDGANEKVKAAQRDACEAMQTNQGFDHVASLYLNNIGAMKAPKPLRVLNLEWVTQGAVDFLDQDHVQPFFLYMSLPVPHQQYYDSQARNPRSKHHWFHTDPLATPGGYLEKRPDCMPSRDDVVRRCDAAGLPRVNTMATHIDDSLGAIMDTLEKRGVADNTLLVFTSDHQSRGKNSAGEAARVPFVVRWPGKVTGGSRSTALASNVDLASTILEATQCNDEESDNGMDGISMIQMLTGQSKTCRKSIYLEVMYTRAVVTDRYKYIACRPPADVGALMEKDAADAITEKRRRRVSWAGVTNTPENVSKGIVMDSDREFPHYFDADQLYDLEADPFEQNNLAAAPDKQVVLDEMKALLKAKLQTLPHTFGEFKTE